MSTGNLFKTYIKVKSFNFKEQVYVIRKFYKNFKFCFIDLSLLFVYLFINPYRTSKKFLKKKNNPNIHLYGEMPLSTFEKVVKECGISSDHTFLELGAGRGRCSFWLSKHVGCKIHAIEWIPSFHRVAIFISWLFRLKNIRFFCENMFNVDFQNPDIIFLYGTCLEDREIYALIDKFKKINHSLKIITISYSLHDYDNAFNVIKEFPITLPWGKTTCFINCKKNI